MMPEVISEEYRKLNARLHEERKDFGVRSGMFAEQVLTLADAMETRDVLDYGCGKGVLQMHLPFAIKQYDPAIEIHSDTPSPAELVVCTDVLEHVEPECLEAVLDDLRRVTKRILFLQIALFPSSKTLADGRNAHLLVRPVGWWLPQLMQRFELRNLNCSPKEMVAVMEAVRSA